MAVSDAGDSAVLRRLEHADSARRAGGDPMTELARALGRATRDAADPIDCLCGALAAWHARHPLRERDVARLFDAILSAVQSDARSDSQEAASGACALLECLDRIDSHLGACLLRDACGWPACSQAPAVVTWLTARRGSFASVLGMDLAGAPRKVLALDDPAIRSREDWNAAIRAAGAVDGELTIGRYAEVRAVYDTEGYASMFSPRERRNVHLGLDLGAAAGTPVHAPLSGLVHSFADNAIAGDYGPTIILEHRPRDLGMAFYTLYGHLRRASLDGLTQRRAVTRGQRIGWIGEAHENGGWPPHLHFQIVTDLLGSNGNFYGVGEAGRLSLWTSLCPDPNLILGLDL